MSLFADDAVVIDPHFPTPQMQGKAVITEALRGAMSGMRSFGYTIVNYCESENGQCAAVETATHHSSRYSLVAHALKGEGEKLIEGTATGRIGLASVPVFNHRRQVIGAVHVQLPPEVSTSSFFTNFAGGFLLAALILLFITIPLSAVFSLITTRGQLNRTQRLVDATTQFASGHYQQRVQVTSEDEFGLLERQFNLMGEQLLRTIPQWVQICTRSERSFFGPFLPH